MTRKLIIVLGAAAIVAVASAPAITDWLVSVGAVEAAGEIRREFLTGTAITVITALLILLPGSVPRRAADRRWPFD